MSVNVTSVTNHYPTANKGFITTTSNTITSGVAQTTVPLTSVAGLTNGTIFVGILGPGTTAEREFTGTVDTAGSQITGVKWTDGSDGTHTAGTTIVDYVSATGQNMQTKGFLVAHDQDGTLKADSVDVTAVIKDAIITPAKFNSRTKLGWFDGELPAVSSVTHNGNRSYTVSFASTVASILSEGMRLELTKTVSGNGYMGGLLNGSSHYFTKTTPSGTLGTVTNNFTIEANSRPSAYGTAMCLAGRVDAAGNNGIILQQDTTGQIMIWVINGGSANFRKISTYQIVSLTKSQHITVTWASGTVVIYFDGVSVPVMAAVTGGTAPTTAGTGGDFSIGRYGANSGGYYSGYISNVAVFDAVLTAATIKQHATYKLTGSETNCIGAWSLDNTANDQSSAGNNLTATGGVGFTAMSPHGQLGNGVETTKAVGLVMAVSGTDVTVQVPEGVTIPTTGGITSVAYSTQANPFGWTNKSIKTLTAITQANFTTTTTPGVVDVSGLSIPYTATGKETIRLKFSAHYLATSGVAATFVQMYVRDGATAIATKGFSTAVSNYAQSPSLEIDFNPTAGAHTFVASCSQNNAGTLTVASASGAPAVFSLEVL